MRIKYLVIFLFLIEWACHTEKKENQDLTNQGTRTHISFDKEKWAFREGREYPYRDQMLNDIVYNDTIRLMTEDQILELLGEPDRKAEDHIYYLIDQKRLAVWTLHTKTMVVKFDGDRTVDWIKIHE